jgi:UTP--glucose-1-phosphate uridylyltransferase
VRLQGRESRGRHPAGPRRPKRVHWAVIPAAGWQARLLSTKATAQVVQRAISEAQKSGIDRSVVVVAPSQKASLAEQLAQLDRLSRPMREKKVRLAEQHEQLGLGHAIMLARSYLPDHEPFALILPDDVVEDSCLTSMVKVYNERKCCVLALRALKKWDEDSYGIVSLREREGSICRLKALAEKPEARPPEPSLAILGRYVLTPDIFHILEATPPNPRSGHIELTDAVHLLAQRQTVYGYIHEGRVRSISPSRRQLMQQLEAFLSV